MTFKELFTKLNFKQSFESDFCVVLTDKEKQFLLFRSDSDISCFSLDFFQYVSLMDLMFLYDFKEKDTLKVDEYTFEHKISEVDALASIFLDIDFECTNDFLLQSIFKCDVVGLRNSSDYGLILKSSYKSSLNVNLLKFNRKENIIVNSNVDCYWTNKEKEHTSAIIAWNPFSLHNFIIHVEDNNEYSSFIFAKNCNNYTLRSPFLYNFEKYIILTSSITDSVEALRLILLFIKDRIGISLGLHVSTSMIELEVSLKPDEESKEWVQLSSNLMARIRNLYYGSESTDFISIKQSKKNYENCSIYYLSFVKSYGMVRAISQFLIEKYDLKVELIKAK